MNVTKMNCCSENLTFVKTWTNYGISTSDMEFITALVLPIYTLVLGTNCLQVYKQYINSDKLAESHLHHFQKYLLLLMPVLSIFNLLLQYEQIDVYKIIQVLALLMVYPYSIYILKIERHKALPYKSNIYRKFIFGFWILAFFMENLTFMNAFNGEWSITKFNRLDVILPSLRYACSLLIFSLGLLTPSETTSSSTYSRVNDNEKSAPLFHKSEGENNKYLQAIKILAQYVWTEEGILFKLRVVSCFVLLFAGNAIHILKPLYEKKILDSVTETPGQFRWELVVIYVGIDVFREIARNLKLYLWDPVEQQITCKVGVQVFRHLHNLSLGWHLQRKTGEVLTILNHGSRALGYSMYYMVFIILPTIIDTILAIIFFVSIFDKWLGLIVFTSMVLYFVISVCLTGWRKKIRKRKNKAQNDQKSRSVDSLLNFETVKCHGAESYEVDCYEKAIIESNREERLSDVTRYLFDTLQNLINNFGILVGSLLCLYMIVNDKGMTVGDYILFTTYIGKLQKPLARVANSYGYIHEQFVDMDSLLKLLQVKPEIDDLPNAKPLKLEKGGIHFSNVSFSYNPEQIILKNINFTVPPGRTVALVGPSGAGKSTMMRLLFRFYDVNSGNIFIDGQDIKTVTQNSLRKAIGNIGVVPQDTVLFNDTIKYNIRYGRMEASDEEVIEAAKHADIHDHILTFADGYETKVGERGLRLSGGEKQRVAIARTILKAPKIVLLDEATSALDIQTERNIQAALNQVCANRTTIIIAHRLSTIIHADEILVLKDGEIVERGKHEDLLEKKGGVYFNMWEAQFNKKEEENV